MILSLGVGVSISQSKLERFFADRQYMVLLAHNEAQRKPIPLKSVKPKEIL